MKGTTRRSLTTVATAAVIAAFALTACGGDDETVPGIESGTTGQTGGSAATDSTGPGNGPDSAGDRDPDAPDSSISDRPGGPDQSQGSQKKDGGGNGSGGVTPPPPSPAVP